MKSANLLLPGPRPHMLSNEFLFPILPGSHNCTFAGTLGPQRCTLLGMRTEGRVSASVLRCAGEPDELQYVQHSKALGRLQPPAMYSWVVQHARNH